MYTPKKAYFYGTGRRKSSIARVRLIPGGTGVITVNNRTLDNYFGMETLKYIVRQPIETVGVAGKFDVEVKVQGGGFTGMWYFPLNYPDIEELGAFADEAMHWCVMTGVLQGTADGRLAPKATADRAQLSAILHRYLTVEK